MINWSDSLSLGIEEIDEQHKELIRMVNMLLTALEQDKGEAVVDGLLQQLREYSVYHFNAEEAFMEKIGYPKRGEHARQHTELKQRVKSYRAAKFHSEEIGIDEIIQLLSQWLLDHILNNDLDIAKFLRGEDQLNEEAGED